MRYAQIEVDPPLDAQTECVTRRWTPRGGPCRRPGHGPAPGGWREASDAEPQGAGEPP